MEGHAPDSYEIEIVFCIPAHANGNGCNYIIIIIKLVLLVIINLTQSPDSRVIML